MFRERPVVRQPRETLADILNRVRLILQETFDSPFTDSYLVQMSGANLEGADLMDAVLTGADLEGATLTGANIEGARIDPATLSKARGIEGVV